MLAANQMQCSNAIQSKTK